MSNVIAVLEKSGERFDIILIKRLCLLVYACILKVFYLGALRTYFKTRKSLAAKKVLDSTQPVLRLLERGKEDTMSVCKCLGTFFTCNFEQKAKGRLSLEY